jgi:Skp family chaperone for outer membrane proteins
MTLVFVGSTLSFVAKAADQKIALVSLQKALNMVDDGKKAQDALHKDYEMKKKQLDALKVDLEKMNTDLEGQKAVLSQDAMNTKRKDLQTKFLDLQTKAADYERDLRTKASDTTQKILLALRDIVVEMSKQQNYSLVIENSAETVLYSQDAVDITDQVIAAYNKKKPSLK